MPDSIKPLFDLSPKPSEAKLPDLSPKPSEAKPPDAPDKVTESRPVEPVTVAIIGNGDNSRLPPVAVAVTQGVNEPNIVVKVVTPMLASVVRFVNLFLTTFVGLVIAGMTPAGSKLLYTNDFVHLVLICASLAFPGAALGFFKDLVTVFGKLEGKYPLATGSI